MSALARYAAIAATMLACVTNAAAREGDLDPTFAGTGKLAFAGDATSTVDIAFAVAIDAENRIVVAGSLAGPDAEMLRWGVVRFLDDGAFDPAFGDGGHVTISFGAGLDRAEPRAIGIEDDGGIVVAGDAGSDIVIARLGADGALDPDFATGGIWRTRPDAGSIAPSIDAIAFVTQPAGGQMIVFAGSSDFDAERPGKFLRGYIDSTGRFPHVDVIDEGDSGQHIFNAMLAQGLSFLMIGTSAFGTTSDCSERRYRFRNNGIGILQFVDDPTFPPLDYVLNGSAGSECSLRAIASAADGTLVLGGDQYNGDPGFDGAFAIGADANGGGNARDVVDAFAPDDGGVGSTRAVLAQADGKIVLAGYAHKDTGYELVVQRRAWTSSSQSPDPSFGDSGTTTIDFDEDGADSVNFALGATQDRQGRVVIVGTTSLAGIMGNRMAIARLQGERLFADGFEMP